MHPSLSGRLWVMGCSSLAGWEYHTSWIYQETIICPVITHQVLLTWFSMFYVPYRPIQPPFLSGQLGVMGVPHWPVESPPIRQTSGLNYMVKDYTSRPPEIVFQCLICSTCPKVLSNASIPQWPVGSNGMFLNGRLGVSHIMHITKRTICPEITHQVHLTWFSMFNVPYRPIQPSFLSGRLGVVGVPHWPVESLPYKTDIGMELYGKILHI